MTKVKICGITNYEDAINASKLGADYIGFNFYKKSPRCIKKIKAKNIIANLPRNVQKVGVFVNEGINRVKEIADFCKIDLIQLSGDEDIAYASKLKKLLKKKIIKAFRIKNKFNLAGFKKYRVDYVMLDSFKEGIYGGTGTEFNWELAKMVDKNRLFLSGGLNASNIKPAIKKLKPYAVDVCSSIESKPGIKNFEKMRAFIQAVK